MSPIWRYATPITMILSAVISGCSSQPKIEESDIKYHTGQVHLYSSKEKEEVYKVEKEKGARYELGISLSGGGVRSASFSIGALAGLNDTGVLDQVDFLSTVSGGGYAGYWFMNSLYFLEGDNSVFDRSVLFNDCYPNTWPLYKGSTHTLLEPCDGRSRNSSEFHYQTQIVQQSDLLNYYQDGGNNGWERFMNGTRQASEFVGKIILHIPTLIPHHLSNSIFDWGYNASSIRLSYQNGIERTYGLVPENLLPGRIDDKEYKNSKSLLWMDNARAESLEFNDMSDYISDRWSRCSVKNRDVGQCKRPPLWIINTTAGVSNSLYQSLDDKPEFNKSIFEITPFSYGSGEYGYVDKPFEQVSISKAVSISGAALDAQQRSSSNGWNFPIAAGTHLVNINLGYEIDNYNPDKANKAFHSLLPFPLYYLHGFSRNKDSVGIRLSDGGHSENLGAYSLIVRGVKNVIIIDAEHNMTKKLTALSTLNKRLKEEQGLELILDSGKDIDEVEFNPYNAEETIITGKVVNYRSTYLTSGNEANFVYVKSGLDLSRLSSNCSDNSNLYPCTVYKFYSHHNLLINDDGECVLNRHKNAFPHNSTFGTAANFSQSIYFAYRDLARHMTKRITFENGKLNVAPREVIEESIRTCPGGEVFSGKDDYI